MPNRLTAARTWLAAALALAGLLGVIAGAPARAPEPSPVPVRWEISLDIGELRLVKIDAEGKGARAYFTLPYKATNTSGQDLLFAPSFELVGADGRIVRAGRDVPADVSKALIARTDNPFVQDQIAIIGPLLRGPENAKEGLVIFPADSLSPGEIMVFAAGFSGETATVTPPTGGDRVILRKTRMLRYADTGDLSTRGDAALGLVEARWIMR